MTWRKAISVFLNEGNSKEETVLFRNDPGTTVILEHKWCKRRATNDPVKRVWNGKVTDLEFFWSMFPDLNIKGAAKGVPRVEVSPHYMSRLKIWFTLVSNLCKKEIKVFSPFLQGGRNLHRGLSKDTFCLEGTFTSWKEAMNCLSQTIFRTPCDYITLQVLDWIMRWSWI